MKTFPVLYKYTVGGSIQQWQIFVKHDTFYTEEGIKDGKLTTSLPTKCYGKNIGKKNQTSPFDQAIAEAAAKHQKKLDKGYNEVLTAEKRFLEPMLAKDYKDVKIEWGKYRVFVQPKLDGLRCISQDNSLMSRNGKPYLACPHLYQDQVTLDGELYTHEYKNDFNKIVSLCKKQKPTTEELQESTKKVQHWVYDWPDEDVFSKRYQALKIWVGTQSNKSIRLVPTFEVKSEADIKNYHEKFLGEGFEGTIIRLDTTNYEYKRSKSLLKYKDFVDEEFKIIGYEEGEGGRAGTIGYFVMQHDKNAKQTFKSNVKGDFDYLKKVWKDRDRYIGKSATVKYFNRTPAKEDGTGDVPRFPYIIKIGRETYE